MENKEVGSPRWRRCGAWRLDATGARKGQMNTTRRHPAASSASSDAPRVPETVKTPRVDPVLGVDTSTIQEIPSIVDQMAGLAEEVKRRLLR